jgi:hypothetical protein
MLFCKIREFHWRLPGQAKFKRKEIARPIHESRLVKEYLTSLELALKFPLNYDPRSLTANRVFRILNFTVLEAIQASKLS